MNFYKKTIICCMVFLLLGLVISCFALSTATEAIKERVDKVLSLLESDKFKEAATTVRIEMLRNTAEGFFDKEEIARRTLAMHWKSFSPKQREKFIDLFQEFLEQNYYKQIGNFEYSGERVHYVDEMVSGSRARVKTEVITGDRKVPVDYSMLLKDGEWVIYDVRIEGVSMIRNYRSQFREILFNKSPQYLLELLEKKVEGFSAE